MIGEKTKRIYRQRYKAKYPWMRSFSAAKSRCTNPRDISYPRYGGKGIRFLMVPDEFERLWIRDKAHMMKSPSIDRKDSKKDYTFDNCQFIEKYENSMKVKYALGSKTGSSKLKEHQVLKIRELAATGKYKNREIAKMFGVGDTCVGQIIKRTRWGWL